MIFGKKEYRHRSILSSHEKMAHYVTLTCEDTVK